MHKVYPESRIPSIVWMGLPYSLAWIYNQVIGKSEMTEDSKPLTAFTVRPLGFYECVQMPFGLINALATFQRLMETCLGEIHLKWCIIYLDDIIVFSKTPEEHIERLKGVFEKLATAGLKLKPSKCEFFKFASCLSGTHCFQRWY